MEESCEDEPKDSPGTSPIRGTQIPGAIREKERLHYQSQGLAGKASDNRTPKKACTE